MGTPRVATSHGSDRRDRHRGGKTNRDIWKTGIYPQGIKKSEIGTQNDKNIDVLACLFAFFVRIASLRMLKPWATGQ